MTCTGRTLYSLRLLSGYTCFHSTAAFPLLRTAGETGAEGQTAHTEKLWALMSSYLASDVHSIQRQIANHVECVASRRSEAVTDVFSIPLCVLSCNMHCIYTRAMQVYTGELSIRH